jgi:enoyl-CoA hydratase/carnithine racemase
MTDRKHRVGRRALLTGAAATAAAAVVRGQAPGAPPSPETTLANVPLSDGTTITVERRDDIVLIGINRTAMNNRLDGATRRRMGEVFYAFDHDASLRVAVLFGHGNGFSRGIDVDAAQANFQSSAAPNPTQPAAPQAGTVDILGKATPPPSKPVVVVAHGDTWNLGHEIYLACDVRIAAANTDFGQDENTHGRFPGGGATVRFVREAGWGNAMRYMLTGDHWSAEESFRMGITQVVAPTPQAALDAGVAMARKIAAAAPLSTKATLTSARHVTTPIEADALARTNAVYAGLYKTEDFLEGRRAEAEGRPPKYRGK